MPRKTPTPTVQVEEQQPTPDSEVVAPEPEVTQADEQPKEISEEERLRAYVDQVSAVVRGLEERVRDLEVLVEPLASIKVQEYQEVTPTPVQFERDPDDDIPDFVNGVQESFNSSTGDNAGWYRG